MSSCVFETVPLSLRLLPSNSSQSLCYYQPLSLSSSFCVALWSSDPYFGPPGRYCKFWKLFLHQPLLASAPYIHIGSSFYKLKERDGGICTPKTTLVEGILFQKGNARLSAHSWCQEVLRS